VLKEHYGGDARTYVAFSLLPARQQTRGHAEVAALDEPFQPLSFEVFKLFEFAGQWRSADTWKLPAASANPYEPPCGDTLAAIRRASSRVSTQSDQ
jgi:hypothetical protein